MMCGLERSFQQHRSPVEQKVDQQ